MAVIESNILGIDLFDSHIGQRHIARIRLVPATAYTASADTLKIGGGGKLFGETNALSLEDTIEAVRRDGKTANLIDGMAGGAGLSAAGAGVYIDTVAVSSDNLTAEFADSASTEVDTATSIPSACEVWVAYDLT